MHQNNKINTHHDEENNMNHNEENNKVTGSFWIVREANEVEKLGEYGYSALHLNSEQLENVENLDGSNLNEQTVYLAFSQDTWENSELQNKLSALTNYLESNEAYVYVVQFEDAESIVDYISSQKEKGRSTEDVLEGLVENAVELEDFTFSLHQARRADLEQKGTVPKEIDITTEDIRIEDILPIEHVEDFKDPSRLPKPTFAKNKSTGATYCLDGQQYIQEAQEAGQESINGVIHYYDSLSHHDSAIEKVATRMKPQSGKARWGEDIKNVKILVNLLMQKDNFYLSSHGGTRKGKKHDENKNKICIRQYLSERLGLDKKTLNEILSHGEHLTDAALDKLIEKNAPRRFFEKHEGKKSNLVSDLEEKSLSLGNIDGISIEDVSIEDTVSRTILQWLNEYRNKSNSKKKKTPNGNSPDSYKEEILDVVVNLSKSINRLRKWLNANDFNQDTLKSFLKQMRTISGKNREIRKIGKKLAF